MSMMTPPRSLLNTTPRRRRLVVNLHLERAPDLLLLCGQHDDAFPGRRSRSPRALAVGGSGVCWHKVVSSSSDWGELVRGALAEALVEAWLSRRAAVLGGWGCEEGPEGGDGAADCADAEFHAGWRGCVRR